MAQGLDGLLGDQGLAAAVTMAAFREAGLLAGGGYGFVRDLHMAQGIDDLLGYQNLAAELAMAALCQAGFGAGRIHSRIGDGVVAEIHRYGGVSALYGEAAAAVSVVGEGYGVGIFPGDQGVSAVCIGFDLAHNGGDRNACFAAVFGLGDGKGHGIAGQGL